LLAECRGNQQYKILIVISILPSLVINSNLLIFNTAAKAKITAQEKSFINFFVRIKQKPHAPPVRHRFLSPVGKLVPTVAPLVEQSTYVPKCKGSDPAATGNGRKLWKDSWFNILDIIQYKG
jgi:hypothetical protein